MKKTSRTNPVAVTAAVVGLLALSSSAGAEDPVHFPDTSLKAAVEQELGRADPTPTDMLALSSLVAGSRSIVDLTGLECATNLTGLFLDNNQISDISPLSALTNLTSLNLAYNQIANCAPLSGLTNLTWLDLRVNLLSDISCLSGLTNLETLQFNRNQVSDISVLSALTKLTDLYAQRNQITDISALSGLTNLRTLVVSVNQITDISVVSGLTNLTHLVVGTNQISDISHVSGLTNLVELDVGVNQISDISAVSNLTNLTWLHVDDNHVSDISAASNLKNLIWLDISGNQISDCSAVSGLTNLVRLYLYENQISDISAVSGLVTLTRLHLGYNQINDISVLSQLANLNELYAQSNQISDISALCGLTNLTRLWILDNPLNTSAYCACLALISANNPGVSLDYDPNPNVHTDDCRTGMLNLELFAEHWLETDCNQANNWCGWADLDHLHDVDLYDFAELARYWVGPLTFYVEDFETGDFSKYGWRHSGDANWIVSTDEVYQGAYSAKSGSISKGQQSVLEITPDIDVASVSFCRKVSCTEGMDQLQFYIDGEYEGVWYGEQDWEIQMYTITPGRHTLKWVFVRNTWWVTGYSDAAWIDEITISP